jgi:lipoprotein NlpD
VGQVLRLAAPGEPALLAQDGATGVTVTPLRAPPPVVDARSGGVAAPVAPAPAASAAGPPAVAPASPSSATVSIKTSPKAIKEPYSDQAVRELTLAASAVPAPPDTLAMAAPGGVRVEPKAEVKPEPRASAPPAPAPPAAPATAPATGGDADRLDWAWPAKGRIIAGFSDTANLKGIDIAGTAGQAVHASAPGRVVYAGSGLRGYGKLIIIKHNATYLSAYAHNREILVKEGQQVARGQKIAEMGNTDADQVKLHFEIRRLGKPMDPTKYLPPA